MNFDIYSFIFGAATAAVLYLLAALAEWLMARRHNHEMVEWWEISLNESGMMNYVEMEVMFGEK